MRKLAWYTSFQRALKRKTRKDSRMEERVFGVLELLAQDAFDPALKTHKLRGRLGVCGLAGLIMIVGSCSPLHGIRNRMRR